jgi:prepilin-type processing-associated H-X9-DG protein
MYTAEHQGYIVPGFIRMQPTGATRGEETWATMLATLNYIPGTQSQLQFQGTGGSPAGEEAWDNIESTGDTIFRCPSGLNNKKSDAVPDPQSHEDPINRFFHRKQSQLIYGAGSSHAKGAMIDNWYGCNAIVPSPANLRASKGQNAWPMRVVGHVRATKEIFGGPLTKATQIRKGSDIVMIYDGLAEHDYNAYKISTRHGKNRKSNMLFADGHCETVDKDQLPQGGTQGAGDLNKIPKLEALMFPKWRLDQK